MSQQVNAFKQTILSEREEFNTL